MLGFCFCLSLILGNEQVALAQTVQWKSYKVLQNGDTINKLDAKNQKQGMWLMESYDDLDQFEYTYAQFVNNKQEGKCLKTNRDGVPVAEENFKNGLKDGEARYYDAGQLLCVGHYLALRARYEYDTIWVENPETNQLRPVRVKSNRGSVRHGFWTYYHPGTKQLARVLEYQADSLIYAKEYKEPADSVQILRKMKTWPHGAQAENLPGVWSEHPEKKPVRFTDFPEDGKGVKPNIRKK
ncbi:MAG: hypothetical protein ACR2IL_11125 [Chitinophagaceae bacterium]